MVTTVSVNKKNEKMIKKLIFSNPIVEVLEFNIGIKIVKDAPIFMQVINMNVNPTLSLLFCFIKSKRDTINKELIVKKP